MKHLKRFAVGSLFVITIAGIIFGFGYYVPYSSIALGFALVIFGVYHIGHGLLMMKGLDK